MPTKLTKYATAAASTGGGSPPLSFPSTAHAANHSSKNSQRFLMRPPQIRSEFPEQALTTNVLNVTKALTLQKIEPNV